jgi:hypothetical protein
MPDTTAESRTLTPPEVARRYRVGTNKVMSWIFSGEMAAMNLATRGAKKARYKITAEALEAFERQRAVVPPPPVSRRRRLLSAPKDYY